MNLMNRLDYSEKRDFIRMSIGAKVTVRAQGANLDGTCHDLSSSGMQIEAPSKLRVGEQIDVTVPSHHPTVADLEARCEVVRIEAAPNDAQLLGLRIIEMDGIKIG
ncbi:PilZ domain-containing protein [Pseudomonas sp. C2L11]|nr:PilZ domain-containing protein [Pseudomonas typographi]